MSEILNDTINRYAKQEQLLGFPLFQSLNKGRCQGVALDNFDYHLKQ